MESHDFAAQGWRGQCRGAAFKASAGVGRGMVKGRRNISGGGMGKEKWGKKNGENHTNQPQPQRSMNVTSGTMTLPNQNNSFDFLLVFAFASFFFFFASCVPSR